jgi:hypothetical protein
VRRQLGDEALRQRLEAIVLVPLGLRLGRITAADGDNGALDRTVRLAGSGGVSIAPLDRLGRRLVLRTDIAALDPEVAVGVDADEYAGACDLGRIVDDSPCFERGERGLDLAEPLVHLVRQFVGLRVFFLEPVVFGLQGVVARTLLVGEIDGLAAQAAEAGGVPIGEVGRDRDPLPALGA